MYTDRFGKKWLKINLHTHTTVSDGRKTPEETADIYRNAGYDAIAITDHWAYNNGENIGGLPIISGCEYNISGIECDGGIEEIYHIVALGCTSEPSIPRTFMRERSSVRARARAIISAIQEAQGAAILAHPAWSLNTPCQMLDIGDYDGTEIYNSVSDWGMSDRPYSGLLIDEAAAMGLNVPLLATDDAHFYDGDHCRGFIMMEADAYEKLGFTEAIRQRRFYASTGPEILAFERISDTEVRIDCSPVSKIAFLSNLVWASGRVVRGEGSTSAVYKIDPKDTFLRAEVTDDNGKIAYSQIINL